MSIEHEHRAHRHTDRQSLASHVLSGEHEEDAHDAHESDTQAQSEHDARGHRAHLRGGRGEGRAQARGPDE